MATSLEEGGTGVVEVRTINVGLTATADGRVFRFRDVGADVTRIEPDGTAVLLISGQVPFDFAGVLKIDLETGEAILEPREELVRRPLLRGQEVRGEVIVRIADDLEMT